MMLLASNLCLMYVGICLTCSQTLNANSAIRLRLIDDAYHIYLTCSFFTILQDHTVIRLSHYYVYATTLSFVQAVYEHFKSCAFDAHSSV